MRKIFIPVVLAASIFMAGCSSNKTYRAPETTAVRWMKNSVEYQALALQTYQTASSQLDELLNDSTETASIEQVGQSYSSLPPAIIVDIDETVLDNMEYEMNLIKHQESYSGKSWNHWVKKESAVAVPGSVKFLNKAVQKGVTIFYITNRTHSVEQATYDNLKKLGFPLKDSVDVILTQNEKTHWNSSKVKRRKLVAKNYRIIMLFGDNFNDFLPSANLSHQKRLQLLNKYHQWFGKKWFILPNPVYGSWQQAIKAN